MSFVSQEQKDEVMRSLEGILSDLDIDYSVWSGGARCEYDEVKEGLESAIRTLKDEVGAM